MTTALAAQLASIRAQSTNSHDLKAQKKAHSQSLLFEPRTAATQSFDVLYQICLEGFEDLCRLDFRFTQFANSIFSEQSKREDRTQMTAAQNHQLDNVLEDFLMLVSCRLLLKPALKAVEWLVRRFRTSRLGYQYPTLVSFWASIATEAIASTLDRASFSKLETQKQNHEDIILFILPVINEILSHEEMLELKVGCYMILTVLASKADLDDGVLTAMMEAVTTYWNKISHAGLICLSVLAEQRDNAQLPPKVFDALIAIKNLDDDLTTLKQQYKVDKLALGVILGIMKNLNKAKDPGKLRLIKILIETGTLSEKSTVSALQCIFSTMRDLKLDLNSPFDLKGALADLVLRLAESQSIGKLLRTHTSVDDIDLLGTRLQRIIGSDVETQDQMIEDVIMENDSPHDTANDFEDLIGRIPSQTAYEISFLSHSESYIFDSLAQVFSSASASESNLNRFSELAVLRKSLSMSEPLFFSFHVRFWCSDRPAHARASAIQMVSKYIEKENMTADAQMLLPYLVYALADPSLKVRRAAGELTTTLSTACREVLDTSKKSTMPILGKESIYGQGRETKDLSWLSQGDSYSFVVNVLSPSLQEFLLDEGHVSQFLSDTLNGSKHQTGPNTLGKDLKKSFRLSIFSFLCSHVVNMPLYKVKSRLLHVLNQVRKVGSASRTKLLMPVLSQLSHKSADDYRRICQNEGLDPSQFLESVMDIVSADDRDGIQSLKKIIESSNRPPFTSLKSAALHRLQGLWSSLKPDTQHSLANALLEEVIGKMTANSPADQEIGAVDTLQSLPLSTTVLQSFIETLPSLPSSSQDKLPASKRRRTSQGQSTDISPISEDLSLAIKRYAFVLELVADAKAERHPDLLKGLFQVLSHLEKSQINSKSMIDYLLVLTLDNMLAIAEKAQAVTSVSIKPSTIRSDVLVDCIRTTVSPQVRNSALLLVANLARITPESILHNVMPIFTFVGNNVLRQGDDFSVYVVKQTMESVIPQLVQSLHKQKNGPFAGVCELLLSFAAAFNHVPAPQRLQLFTSLVDRVGPKEYLFALSAILIDKYPADRKVLQFAADVASAYDVNIRLSAVTSLLDLVLDAQGQHPSSTVSSLISSKDHDSNSTGANLLQLPIVVLNDQALISRVQKKLAREGVDAMSIKEIFTSMLEKTFLLSKRFKDNERLTVVCLRVLDALLALLPMSNLVDTLQGLLECTEDHIRRRVLQSFQRRLDKVATKEPNQQRACLSFLSRLQSTIQDTSDVSLRHIAIGSVDKITEKFGKKDVSIVIESAKVISQDASLKATENGIRVVSLLCLATMVEVTGESSISFIPNAFSKALDNLTLSIQEDTEDTGLHDSVYTLLNAILLYIPWALSEGDSDRILKTSYESANAEMGEECNARRIEALQLMPKQMEAKAFFTALHRTWLNAMTEGPLAVSEYVSILRLGIDRHPKSIIVKQSENLGDLLMRMLDLRRIQLSPPTEDSYSIDEIEEVESAVNDVAVAMIYKLNDATFRPLFSRILEWSTHTESSDKSAKLHRQTSWYRFLYKFFNTLKSIVTSYSSFILDESVEILGSTSSENTDSTNLWRQVIVTLRKTFEHDQDEFYQSPNHFTPVHKALLAQFPKAAHIPLQPELIPAIAELAVVTDSAAHHQEMNRAILQHMRSDSAAVRLAAVQCERALTERLGEEWLALLPEMLPFISEALEDDEEDVEREVQRWVVGIEGILGESLTPMLQ
ncbi:snoRNA-binding rRNA-processing protein utp10 [Lecanora helva]